MCLCLLYTSHSQYYFCINTHSFQTVKESFCTTWKSRCVHVDLYLLYYCIVCVHNTHKIPNCINTHSFQTTMVDTPCLGSVINNLTQLRMQLLYIVLFIMYTHSPTSGVCIFTHTHTHTHLHACIHTQAHIMHTLCHTHIHMHTHIIYTCTHTHTLSLSHMHTHSGTHAHTLSHTHIHVHTHAHTHTHTYTCTHIHKHACM